MNAVTKGDVAILIGAGKANGVGAATALLLAQKGYNILINCRQSESEANELVRQCRDSGVEAELFMADVTSSHACKEMAEYVEKKWGRANVLVNCLGTTKIAPYDKLDQLTGDDFARIFSVNVTAPYLVVQAFEKLLRNSTNSSVVNVSSTAGMSGSGSSIAYCASKGALNTLTLSLAMALSPQVRVNAVCPGFIDSSWWGDSATNKDAYNLKLQSVKDSNLLHQVITPSDVGNIIVNIINSPKMTGELVRVDAGKHLVRG